jgi:hypothetical protein
MNHQTSLFDPGEPPPAQRHSETSLAAAAAIEPDAATLRGKCLDHLRHAPDGATDEEQQEDLRMNPSTQRPRRIELLKAGWIRDSGKRRPTRSGRQAVVWIAVKQKEV